MSTTQQKALLLPEKHGQFTVGESTIPKPGPGQLLIRAHAAALNPVDWQIREYGLGLEKYPAVIGFDGAGEVVEVGEGQTTFEKGDRVCVELGFFIRALLMVRFSSQCRDWKYGKRLWYLSRVLPYSSGICNQSNTSSLICASLL